MMMINLDLFTILYLQIWELKTILLFAAIHPSPPVSSLKLPNYENDLWCIDHWLFVYPIYVYSIFVSIQSTES